MEERFQIFTTSLLDYDEVKTLFPDRDFIVVHSKEKLMYLPSFNHRSISKHPVTLEIDSFPRIDDPIFV